MRNAMKTLRERLGLSADIFGGLCGVSGPYIYMLESGQRPWNSKLMTKMNHKLALL
jgi:transcriptional regulator with XRE-family HTH domain